MLSPPRMHDLSSTQRSFPYFSSILLRRRQTTFSFSFSALCLSSILPDPNSNQDVVWVCWCTTNRITLQKTRLKCGEKRSTVFRASDTTYTWYMHVQNVKWQGILIRFVKMSYQNKKKCNVKQEVLSTFVEQCTICKYAFRAPQRK